MKDDNTVRPLEMFRSAPKWQQFLLLVIVTNFVAYAAVGCLDACFGFYRNSIANPLYAGQIIAILIVFSLVEIALKKILVAGTIITILIGTFYSVMAFGNSFQGTKGWVDSIVLVLSVVGMLVVSMVLLNYGCKKLTCTSD